MRRGFIICLLLAVFVVTAGCAANQYVIQTKDGKEYVTDGEPVFNKAKQSYAFTDPKGTRWMINRDEIVSIELPGKGDPAKRVALLSVNRKLTIHNGTGNPVTVYLGFSGNTLGCYSPADFSFCSFDTGNAVVCRFSLDTGADQPIDFSRSCKVSPAVSVNCMPWGPCPCTLAEFTFADANNRNQDTYDISLVNGMNVLMSIVPTTGKKIEITSAGGNQGNAGVYPLGCDGCAVSIQPPPWPNCPPKDQSQCHGGTQMNPSPDCHFTQATGSSYTVNIK